MNSKLYPQKIRTVPIGERVRLVFLSNKNGFDFLEWPVLFDQLTVPYVHNWAMRVDMALIYTMNGPHKMNMHQACPMNVFNSRFSCNQRLNNVVVSHYRDLFLSLY